jgi:hypothetical protein
MDGQEDISHREWEVTKQQGAVTIDLCNNTCLPVSPTEHFPINCSLNITSPPRAPIIKRLSRAVTSIDASKFSHDILSSRIIRHILLLLFLILSTAITLLCLNFSTNMHL